MTHGLTWLLACLQAWRNCLGLFVKVCSGQIHHGHIVTSGEALPVS